MCYFSVTVVLHSSTSFFKAVCSLIAIIHQFKAFVLINAEEQR